MSDLLKRLDDIAKERVAEANARGWSTACHECEKKDARIRELEAVLTDIAESGHRGDTHPKGSWVPKAENGSQMIDYFASGWSKCMDVAKQALRMQENAGETK